MKRFVEINTISSIRNKAYCTDCPRRCRFLPQKRIACINAEYRQRTTAGGARARCDMSTNPKPEPSSPDRRSQGQCWRSQNVPAARPESCCTPRDSTADLSHSSSSDLELPTGHLDKPIGGWVLKLHDYLFIDTHSGV